MEKNALPSYFGVHKGEQPLTGEDCGHQCSKHEEEHGEEEEASVVEDFGSIVANVQVEQADQHPNADVGHEPQVGQHLQEAKQIRVADSALSSKEPHHVCRSYPHFWTTEGGVLVTWSPPSNPYRVSQNGQEGSLEEDAELGQGAGSKSVALNVVQILVGESGGKREE